MTHSAIHGGHTKRNSRFLILVTITLILYLLAPSQILAAPETNLITVDNSSNVGGYTSLAFNSSGNAVISYWDFTNDDLKLAVCNDAACTNPAVTTVDSSGQVGEHTSLALNSSDHAVISYQDATNLDLKLAVCNVESCTNPALTTLDNSKNVGQHSALAITA